jgi:acetyl esterase/lipase
MASDGFHPDLRAAARWLPRAAVSPRTLKPVRMLTGLQARRAARDGNVRQAGPVSVRVHQPKSGEQPRPALLWIHGGGFVMGTASQDDALCRYFADQVGALVVAVEYRLAPEHQFPEPLQDCYEALKWLAAQPGVDRSRIAIGGASAGGGLATGLALMARDRNEVPVAFQLLVYPMLDDRTATRAMDETRVRLWNNKANRFGWQSYTGHAPGSAEVTGLAAPARCEDLAGLPPAWIGVGTLDLFYDEDVDYASRLADAGVKCELETVPGAFHGFDSIRSGAPVSKAFRASQAEALASALARVG